jgi:hypothetical protein
MHQLQPAGGSPLMGPMESLNSCANDLSVRDARKRATGVSLDGLFRKPLANPLQKTESNQSASIALFCVLKLLLFGTSIAISLLVIDGRREAIGEIAIEGEACFDLFARLDL